MSGQQVRGGEGRGGEGAKGFITAKCVCRRHMLRSADAESVQKKKRPRKVGVGV